MSLAVLFSSCVSNNLGPILHNSSYNVSCRTSLGTRQVFALWFALNAPRLIAPFKGGNDVSVWTWLLESDAPASPTTSYGFRDGNTGHFLSHKDLKTIATAASIALAKDYSLTAGLTVAIVSRNSIWYPAAMLSVNRLGGVVTVLPPEAKSADLAYYLEASRSVLVFTDAEAMDQVRNACQSLKIPISHIISLDGSRDEAHSFQQLAARGNSLLSDHFVDPWKPPRQATSPCAFLCFSSGTTGKSKAVSGSKRRS